jgi:hypothetical protein
MAHPTILIRELARIVKLLEDIRSEAKGIRGELRQLNGRDSIAPEHKPLTKSQNNGYLNGGPLKK